MLRGLGWFTQAQTLQGLRDGEGGQEPEVWSRPWVLEGRQRGSWGLVVDEVTGSSDRQT